MSIQKRSLLGRISRAWEAFREPLRRVILPLNSADKRALPGQSMVVTGRVVPYSIRPDRLVLSRGGEGGAEHWIVNDIKIAGRSQFGDRGPRA